MDELSGTSLSLPPYALMPAIALFAVILFAVLSRTSSRAAQFVVFATWLRYILSAFHTVTFKPSPIGLSWNALGSIGIFVLGLLVIRRRRLFDAALVPMYLLAIVVLASGFANHAVAGMVNTLVKYAYLAVIIMATADAIEDLGEQRFFNRLLWPFVIPFGLQALSIVLGIAKAGERDGSASYIGGFSHEAAFSIALATGLLVVCMTRRFNPLLKLLLVAACCVGILLANYRTAILAMAPLIGAVVLTGTTRRFVPQQRALITGAMALAVLGAAFAGAWAGRERFADLAVAASEGEGLIKPPNDFSETDKDLLSGRAYIWSDYIYGYADSRPIQHIIGLGPDSWVGVFKLYAHNTLVSSLYELGIAGVGAILFLWTWMLILAIRIREGPRARIVAAHLSFIVLNMATMPMWMIEGMIFYGILCGYTVYCFRRSHGTARAPCPKVQPGESP